MQGGGTGQLAGGLYNESFSLEVTARRRKTASVTNSVLAGTQGGTTTLNVAVDATDQLQPNDGLLFDLVLAQLSAAATGLTIVTLAFSIQDTTQAKFFPVGQATLTTLAIPVAPPSSAILQVTPAMLSAFDIGFGLEGQPVPVPATDQPLKLTLQAIANNPTAGGINLTTKLVVFYRIIHGLQEG